MGTFIEKLLVSILNMSLRYLRISCKISFVVIIMSEEMTYADMAELADALVLGTSGQPCRFKSCYPHLEKVPVKTVLFCFTGIVFCCIVKL